MIRIAITEAAFGAVAIAATLPLGSVAVERALLTRRDVVGLHFGLPVFAHFADDARWPGRRWRCGFKGARRRLAYRGCVFG
jgi:hypothetical protein